MSLKELFSDVATAIGMLRAHADPHLFDDQRAKIDAAIINLRDAETGFEEKLQADVDAAIAKGLGDFAQRIGDAYDHLAARVSSLEDDAAEGLGLIRDELNGGGDSTLADGAGDDTITGDAGGATEAGAVARTP